MALDTVIMEEHTAAACILADSFHDDPALFENVPGVAAVRIEMKPEPVYDPGKEAAQKMREEQRQEHKSGHRKPRGREVARA